ncbi:hypothetical protein HPB50_023945 [Hyalomma asiaticum]|uniref:Uncharacterized protein n=1 Tax=Hyalomma asiaticum TaxID=266040 RepID=A0ACB7S2H1_HYAAI|nr:hypothetical protein HPB50_023945 [Hyalomma asiaticum]
MSDNEFRQMLPVLMVKQQAATYTNGLYVFSAKCSGKVLSDDAGDQNTCTGRQELIDRFLDDGNLDAADALTL